MKDLFLLQFCQQPENYHATIKRLRKHHRRCRGKSKRQKIEIASNIVNNGIRSVVFSLQPYWLDNEVFRADEMLMVERVDASSEQVILHFLSKKKRLPKKKWWKR
jgi:hypothetical protein